ncbi:diguanylate cyclase [Rhodovarius crocodyli]|uniref:diguanylate cyclase n=2 Tax=Rhodovarius crocodyli TaxID=1979269 RepID=A0A437MK33_9PROT|nr:diguanylate cyclase [Rhodovarius crocodyli]
MTGISPEMADLLRQSTVLIAVFDETDRLRWANAAYRRKFNLPDDASPSWAELLRANWQEGLGVSVASKPFDEWLASAASRRGKQPYRAFETDLTDGTWIWMTETMGSTGWMLCIGSDITALATRERDLRYAHAVALRASQTDELTGVANRRHIMSLLEDMARERQEGCVAVMDIDHFKAINDTHGHPGGDTVLVDFASRVLGGVRRSDSFGRIGGEEFLLVMPGLCPDTAREILERVQRDIHAARPLPEVPGFRYGFSCGVTAIGPGESAAEVFARADRACYLAKQQGRDRIVTG